MTPKINICRINRGIGDRVASWPRYPSSFLSKLIHNDYIFDFYIPSWFLNYFNEIVSCVFVCKKLFFQQEKMDQSCINVARRRIRILMHFFDEGYVRWKCCVIGEGKRGKFIKSSLKLKSSESYDRIFWKNIGIEIFADEAREGIRWNKGGKVKNATVVDDR